MDFPQQEKDKRRKILWTKPCYSDHGAQRQKHLGQSPKLHLSLFSDESCMPEHPQGETAPLCSLAAPWKERGMRWSTEFPASHISLVFRSWAVQCRVSQQSCMEREPLEKSHCQPNTCTDKGSPAIVHKCHGDWSNMFLFACVYFIFWNENVQGRTNVSCTKASSKTVSNLFSSIDVLLFLWQ